MKVWNTADQCFPVNVILFITLYTVVRPVHKLILCSQLAKTIFNTLTFLLIRLEQFYEYDRPLTIAYQQIVNKQKQERNAYMCGLCCFLRRLNTLESDPISLPRYSFPNLYIVLFTYASKCLIVDCEPSNIDLFPGKYLPRPSINIKYVFVFTKLSWQPIRDRNCPMEISWSSNNNTHSV